jgi:hypothetical protein
MPAMQKIVRTHPLATALLLAVIPVNAPARIDPSFGPGSYTIEQRVKRDLNPYAGDRLDFIEGGLMVWTRDGQPVAMMQWEVKQDLLRIEDTDLCPVAPIALYRVRWQERGFVMEVVSDDCGQRSASATTMVLVPLQQR